jgi:hypothetical protein
LLFVPGIVRDPHDGSSIHRELRGVQSAVPSRTVDTIPVENAAAAPISVCEFLGEVWETKGLAVLTSANPSSLMVAGARNVPTANASAPLEFRARVLFSQLRKGMSVRSRSSRNASPPQSRAPNTAGNKVAVTGTFEEPLGPFDRLFL